MNKNRNQFGGKSRKEAVKHLMVIISAAMCDTRSADVGDESSHYALQSISHCLISARFFLSFELAADLPTCCRKGHGARGYDLTVLPCWSVRPERATPTLSDRPCEHMHENWYVHKGSAERREGVHSRTGTVLVEPLLFVSCKQLYSEATGTLRCTWTTLLNSWASGETVAGSSPRLLSSIFH